MIDQLVEGFSAVKDGNLAMRFAINTNNEFEIIGEKSTAAHARDIAGIFLESAGHRLGPVAPRSPAIWYKMV